MLRLKGAVKIKYVELITVIYQTLLLCHPLIHLMDKSNNKNVLILGSGGNISGLSLCEYTLKFHWYTFVQYLQGHTNNNNNHHFNTSSVAALKTKDTITEASK